MANLLTRKTIPFPRFTDEQRVRFEERARFLVGRTLRALVEALPGLDTEFEADLEELDAAPSLASAQAILSRLESLRCEAFTDADPDADLEPIGEAQSGDWIGYRPGRSEETGEAEIASRGYFDVRDRPPLATWVSVVARPRAEGSGDLDLAILCYVPSEARDRALAGREACPNGSLDAADAMAPEIATEIHRLMDGVDPA